MVLNKRILRDFRQNAVRNIAMILIISLSMAMVVALCSTTECISYVIHSEWKKTNVEDGSFETYIPLSKRNMSDLSELDVVIEKMFYTDIYVNSVSHLRFFTDRKYIDRAYPEEGRVPRYDNELFIEKLYAQKHSLNVGDEFYVGDRLFYICGIGCLPDYCYVKQNTSDVAANDEFSVALVTSKAFDEIRGTNKIVYNYAFKLGQNCTAKQLRKKLAKLDFDTNAVSDTYIRSLVNSADDLKKEFNGAMDSISFGAAQLAHGIENIGKAYGAGSSSQPLYNGAMNISYAAAEIKDGFSEFLEQNTKVELVNLSSFSEAKYSIRINDALNDSKLGKQAALVVGVILLLLLVYMLSIFASGTIEKERGIIGTLYALGYSKNEILSHYLKTPMIVSCTGALIGFIGGILLTDPLSMSYSTMYSFPEIVHVYPLYLVLYALGVPTVLSYLINRRVLGKKLSETPLSMMHAKITASGKYNFDLGKNFNFETKFRIRQFCRELKGNLTLFAGVIISVLLIMFSVACYGSISSYINCITDDVNYNYLYILQNPVSDLPDNSVVGYTLGFNVDYALTGGEMEVTLSGIGADNPYFDFAPTLSEEPGEVYMSDAVRTKFGYHVGDTVVFHDNSEDRRYAFKIAGEVKFGSGLYFFMNLDAMREAFGLDYFDKDELKRGQRPPKACDYYYNTVYSDEKLEFRHNMALSEVVKTDLESSAAKFMTLMWDMILLLIGVSVIIFVSVMYLLMKLEIDRSNFSVSLLKALGYPEKTVNSFYIGSSFYVTLASIIIGMPICRVIIKYMYPYCVSNVNGGFPAVITPIQYAIIIAIVLASYFATRLMLVRYLSKIKLTEILKNRE